MGAFGGIFDSGNSFERSDVEAGAVKFEVDSLDVEGNTPLSLEDFLDLVGFDFVHPDMTSTNFELYNGAIPDFKMYVVQLKVKCKKNGEDASISLADVELLLGDRGLRPANLEEYFLLCFNYPNFAIKYNIGIILGTEITFDVGGEERVMVPLVQHTDHTKTLNLVDKHISMSEDNVFFAVSKNSGIEEV